MRRSRSVDVVLPFGMERDDRFYPNKHQSSGGAHDWAAIARRLRSSASTLMRAPASRRHAEFHDFQLFLLKGACKLIGQRLDEVGERGALASRYEDLNRHAW
jgi:hypothetical protein